jgi:hypothetical protein
MTEAANFLSFDEMAILDDTAYMTYVRSIVPEPASETIAKLDAQIRAFEARYEMTSEIMRQRLASGAQEETLDVCDWLMALDLRTRLASSSGR